MPTKVFAMLHEVAIETARTVAGLSLRQQTVSEGENGISLGIPSCGGLFRLFSGYVFRAYV